MKIPEQQGDIWLETLAHLAFQGTESGTSVDSEEVRTAPHDLLPVRSWGDEQP